MSQKIKKIVVLSFVLIISSVFTRCQKEDDVSSPQSSQLSLARNWFKEYESSGENYALFQNLAYDWNEASITKSEDGTATIIVPVIELKKDQKEIWEQKLYLYKSGTDSYKAVLFEIYSNKNIEVSSQTIEGGDFTGYVTAWDLKTGFVRAAKFINNQVVEIGDAEFSNDISLTSRAPIEAPCVYSGGDGGCDKGGGKAIELREVVVTGPSAGSPVVYIPRDAVTGGISTGGFTSPGAGGASSGGGGSNENAYPDCASFNFIKLKGLPWQEAAIRNIRFKIEIIQSLTPLVKSSETIILTQAVSFQMPTNTSTGNTNISPGIAASVTAKAINMAMKQTKDYYKAVPATELMVTQFFKKALKDTFELMTPGSRLQINPISTVPPTEYQSNWFLPSNCN